MPKAIVFDAYGTLYDVHSVQARCEFLWPGKGAQLSQLWRSKQLEYTWQRSLMRRYVPFSEVTREALEYCCAALGLVLAPESRQALMAEYLRLAPYPDAAAALRRLDGYRRVILTNGSHDMIDPLVAHSGLAVDRVLSVDSVKIYKPAPEVYQYAIDQLDLPKAPRRPRRRKRARKFPLRLRRPLRQRPRRRSIRTSCASPTR